MQPSLGLIIQGTFASRRPVAEAGAEVLVSVPLDARGQPSWPHARVAGAPEDFAAPRAHAGPIFAPVPASALTAAALQSWLAEARTKLGEALEVPVLRSGPVTGIPFETSGEFRLRLEQAAREERDAAVRKLREKFATRTRSADEKLTRAREAVARESSQAHAAQLQTAISVGTTILGALFGRKAASLGNISRAGTAARGATRAMKQTADVGTAREKLAAAEAAALELEEELKARLDELPSPATASTAPETLRLKLLPSTLQIKSSGILWTA